MNSSALIVGQYAAALEMLKNAVALCPEELWTMTPPKYPFWRTAYHAVFFTHLYACSALENIKKWKYHDTHMEDLDGPLPTPENAYTSVEIAEYARFTLEQIEYDVPTQDMEGPSGIPWWNALTKLEMHVYSIRHTQHHVGQLADRLRNDAHVDLPWIGKK